MSNENGKETLATFLEPELAACVRQEAKDKAVSISAVIRWALMERYERQLEQVRQFADGQVSITP
jgi:hypothetical protein